MFHASKYQCLYLIYSKSSCKVYVKWVTHNTLNLQYLVKDCYWLQSTHKDTFAFHKGTFTLPKKSYFSFTIWLTTFVFLLQVRIKLKICRATQLFSPCSRSLLCKTFLEVVLPTVEVKIWGWKSLKARGVDLPWPHFHKGKSSIITITHTIDSWLHKKFDSDESDISFLEVHRSFESSNLQNFDPLKHKSLETKFIWSFKASILLSFET